MVKRSGGADLSASRSLTADSVMNNSLTGASVTSLAFFCHGINALPAVYPDTYLTPPLHAHFCMPCISLNCSWPILVCRPKSEKGRKAAPETMRSSTATITRKRVFGPSVGLGVLLRRCATAASHIACPRTLTSHCLRAWKECRPSLLLDPSGRATFAGGLFTRKCNRFTRIVGIWQNDIFYPQVDTAPRCRLDLGPT